MDINEKEAMSKSEADCSYSKSPVPDNISDDEKIDIIAGRILENYLDAFVELAK